MNPQRPTYFLEFTRICSQRTNNEILAKQLDYILDRGMSGGRGKGWSRTVIPDEPVRDNDMWKFRRTVRLVKSSGRAENAHEQFKAMLEVFEQTLPQPNAGGQKYPWYFVVPNMPAEIQSTPVAPPVNVPVKYNKLNFDRKDHFKDIFDRDSQIEIILSAIHVAIETNMSSRFHCVLWGPPACGKSSVLIDVGKMLGEEGEAYVKFDATSFTEAGVRKYLIEQVQLGKCPPLLFVEEIEKTEEKSLRWLLGLMDTRGEIRITNFKVGNVRESVPMLVLATVNNLDKFKEVLAGALASRFSHEIYFPRPSRDILKRILYREVATLPDTPENKNRELWIDKTLEFAYDGKNIDDPRKLVPIALCGKDKLLTGEYQECLKKTDFAFYQGR